MRHEHSCKRTARTASVCTDLLCAYLTAPINNKLLIDTMEADILVIYDSLYKLLDHEPTKHPDGASEVLIETLEYDIGHKLPAELRQLYLYCNGESEFQPGIFSGYEFLDIDTIYSSIEGLEENAKHTHELETWPCHPKNTIRKQPYNPNWIPFAGDSSGGYIGLDFDPDVKGVQGQIINFGAFEYYRVQVAVGFRALLEELQRGYNNKEYHDGAFPGSMSIVDTLIDRYQ